MASVSVLVVGAVLVVQVLQAPLLGRSERCMEGTSTVGSVPQGKEGTYYAELASEIPIGGSPSAVISVWWWWVVELWIMVVVAVVVVVIIIDLP